MDQSTEVQHALAEGALRSLRACSVPADDPLPIAIWRRHRWTIIGVALFLLLELASVGGISGGMPNH